MLLCSGGPTNAGISRAYAPVLVLVCDRYLLSNLCLFVS